MGSTEQAASTPNGSGLKKSISLPYLWALASATILGPWLVMTQWWYSLTGPSLSLAFLVTMILMIPVAFCYSEMVSMLPYAGGSYNFIGHAFGTGVSFIFMWSQTISYFAVTAFNMMCVIQILQYSGILPMTTEYLIGAGLVFAVIYCLMNWFKVELSVMVQYVLFWLLFITGLIWNGIDLFFAGTFNMANFTPFFVNGTEGFLVAVGVMVTMYFGFEVVAHMSEEANYPSSKMWIPVIGSVITAGIVYMVTLTAMAGAAPYDYLINTINVPGEIIFMVHGVNLWSQVGWLGIVLGGLACALTCVDGFWLALSRLFYSLGEANLFPSFFKRINKHHVPGLASIVVFLGVCPLIIFSGSSWIATLFVIMGLAIAVVYVGSTLSFIMLRYKYPDWKRPYKAPGGYLMGILGVIGSLLVTYWSATALTMDGWYLIAGYIVVGVLVYFFMSYYRKSRGLKTVLMPPIK